MTRTEWLHNYEAIYLDLHKLQDEIDFCHKIQDELTPVHQTKPRTNKNATRVITETLENRNVLLILDEVDELVQSDFKIQLQKAFRGLVQDGTLSLLAASRKEINKVFIPDDDNSPLHNVFTAKKLENFDRATMERFIHERLDRTGIHFTAQEIDNIWQDTRGLPNLVQREAENLFEHKIKQQ